MNKNNIIIAGAIAIGLYLFSQGKKIPDIVAVRKAAAQKIGKKIGKTVAQNITQKRIGVPISRAAYIAARRKAAARKAAVRKAALRKVAQNITQKRIGVPISRAAYIAARRKAAARKAAVRKAAAQKIGKKIGKTVAQKMSRILKARRAAIAWHAKRQRPQIQRPRPQKKQIASRLFSGAEKSRIIPYSEASKHSYYGPKSHKLLNEGYRVESNKRQANSVEANHRAVLREVLSNPKLWRK